MKNIVSDKTYLVSTCMFVRNVIINRVRTNEINMDIVKEKGIVKRRLEEDPSSFNRKIIL